MQLLQPGFSGARASSSAAFSCRRSRLASERGQALLETAMTLPLVLLVCVGIFEFGRAYQTYQVITNAAREGARVAVLPSGSPETVQSRVLSYMQAGQLPNANSATINLNRNATVTVGAGTASASVVTVTYPFRFMVLNPVANLVSRGTSLGGSPFSMTVVAEMRNEAQ